MSRESITVLGAGLVGSLAAIYLSRRGYRLQIFEKRPDLRKEELEGGRSINLALSHRGLRALEKVGLLHQVTKICLPMKGRMIHDLDGHLDFQPYGREGQYINSISRSQLNALLMDAVEATGNKIEFQYECLGTDLENGISFLKGPQGPRDVKSQFIVGADGAFSAIREEMHKTDRFNFSQYYLPHGYKELTIPASDRGSFALDPEALHIWPREQFMLIALPNLDKSFTCTLFLPFHGVNSFDQLNNGPEVTEFFKKWFKDALVLMPDLQEDYFYHPASSMVTIKCSPWRKDSACLLGDAAHAIVPFYGQGMNAGFEDCRLFDEILSGHHGNFDEAFDKFQQQRIPDTNAIAELAFDNFIEMRDLVVDPLFVLRKKIERKIHKLYPEDWIPLYSMVTFSDTPYRKALQTGSIQHSIMNKVLQQPGIESSWEEMDFSQIIKDLKVQVEST